MSHGRAAQWSDPDGSSNVYLNIVTQVSCLYDREPTIVHPDPRASEALQSMLRCAGWSGIGQQVQRHAVGLGESLIRVDVLNTSTGPEVVLRPITPDHVVAIADHDRPDRAIEIREIRLRTSPVTQVREWLWDVWSVRDPQNPSHRVLRDDVDVSAEFLGIEGGLTGEAYPYKDSRGRAHLPYVTYHARRTGRLWDAFSNSELIEGSLNAAMLYTFFNHCFLSASWPGKYMVGLEPVGAVSLADGSQIVESDPAIITQFRITDNFTGQPLVGQFAPGADPEVLLAAVSQYEQRLAQFAGISASEFTRQSGDPRSAYALLISREGKREAARKYEQTFGDSDAELCRLIAIMSNATAGTSLPESDYSIQYTAIPLTVEEVRANREHVLDLLDRRLISRVDAVAEIEGITKVEAKRRLLEINANDVQEEVDDNAATTAPKAADPEAVAPVSVPAVNAPTEPTAPSIGITPDGVQAASPAASLNGAQVTSAVAIVTAVAMGQLPRDSGVSMLIRFFALSNDAAEEIMGSVGKGFAPVLPAVPAPVI